MKLTMLVIAVIYVPLFGGIDESKTEIVAWVVIVAIIYAALYDYLYYAKKS